MQLGCCSLNFFVPSPNPYSQTVNPNRDQTSSDQGELCSQLQIPKTWRN